MIETVFDIEADGLDATRIHVLSANFKGKIRSVKDYSAIRKLVERKDVCLIAHNVTRYDKPTIERIVGCKFKAKIVDTLALSWYLWPERARHGLGDWGEEFGVPKPKVDDWEGLSYEEYRHRCEEDVKINTLLWKKIKRYLLALYKTEERMWGLIEYLQFKMDCAALQEKSRWRLDVPKAEALEKVLAVEHSKAIKVLESVMPKVPIWTVKNRPAKPYKQSGELSVHGERWFKLLEEHNQHPESKSVKYISGYTPPNGNSDPQIKAWLFSLGWQPCTFKYKRDKETGDVKQIPQVRMKDGDNQPMLTPSVKALAEKVPEVEALVAVGVVKHRLDVVRGFLRNVTPDGFIRARIKGLTNTLRFKHEEVVNLPGVDKPWGADLRGCLISREGYELCGSDMSSLEDRTKQHYMFDYDPDYVKEMMTPDFDPHIDIAVQGGLMSKEDGHVFKNADEEFRHTSLYKALKSIRSTAKATNYSCVYGAGGATVARAAGISEPEGVALVKTYWERNWAVKAVAEAQKVITVEGQMWLLNPVSNFYYSLRYEKDRFSTLNQGTGVFCFDTWIKFVLSKRPQLTGQMHDEIILEVKKGNRKSCERLLKWAIKETNKVLNLNRDLDVDVQFGDSYADIH